MACPHYQRSCRKRQQIVAGNGNKVAISGNFVAVSGNNVAVSGNFVAVFGDYSFGNNLLPFSAIVASVDRS